VAADKPIVQDGTVEIKSLQDVATYLDLPPDATEAQISRAVYDMTECGAFLDVILPKDYGDNGPGVVIGSVVEGSKAGTTSHFLYYPFNGADFDYAIGQVEEEASEIWHAANCHKDGCDRTTCKGCKDDCDCFDDGSETPDHPGFDTAFLW
jgi:hypothetical protein